MVSRTLLRFQYGELHFGHHFGLGTRGTQYQPHRRQQIFVSLTSVTYLSFLPEIIRSPLLDDLSFVII